MWKPARKYVNLAPKKAFNIFLSYLHQLLLRWI